MKDKIMPPLVLTIICIVVSGLLVLAYNATYVDNTGVLTDDMKKGCEEIFGKGDYEIMLDGEGDSKTPVTFDTEGVNSIITDKDNGRCVIEITEDGYSKGGLHLLIGINSEGTIEGIEFLSIGETPGLGTKVQDDSFLSKLKGFGVDTDENSIDNVTAATYSSKGMKSACYASWYVSDACGHNNGEKRYRNGTCHNVRACLLKLCYIPFEKRYPKGCKTALFYRNNRRLRYSYRVSYERLYT